MRALDHFPLWLWAVCWTIARLLSFHYTMRDGIHSNIGFAMENFRLVATELKKRTCVDRRDGRPHDAKCPERLLFSTMLPSENCLYD
jgi:hypothetical protein